MPAAARSTNFVVKHDGALAVAICEREPESEALRGAVRGMSLTTRTASILGGIKKFVKKLRGKNNNKGWTPCLARCSLFAFHTGINDNEPHIRFRLHGRNAQNLQTYNFEDRLHFPNCPGMMAPTRALKDETVAGQPIQSFTGISVNMRQLFLSAISACLQPGLLSKGYHKGSNQPRHIVAISALHATRKVHRQLPISHDLSSLPLLIKTW